MAVQWYPGHMARARRQLMEAVQGVDVVIEVADARIPRTSRNPELPDMIGGKPVVLVLNKADLADPAANRAWLAAVGGQALALTATHSRQAGAVVRAVEQAAAKVLERAAGRGMSKVLRALVAGVPNTGKSTLINSLNGKAVAQVADRAGVTRGQQWVKAGPYFELLDTPGLLWPRIDDPLSAHKLAFFGSMRDDAMDVEALARGLLDWISGVRPGLVEGIYGAPESLGEELLEGICLKKGWLVRGGNPDTLRGARMILDAFRAGKWGRLTLEMP